MDRVMVETPARELKRPAGKRVWPGYAALVLLCLAAGGIGGTLVLKFHPPVVSVVPPKTGVQDVIMAEKFYVVDRQGKNRAVLGVNEDGTVALNMIGPEGETLVTLGQFTSEAPALSLYDVKGKPRVMLGGLPHGRMGLSLYDSAGETHLEAALDEMEMPLVELRDRAAHIRGEWKLLAIGVPQMRFYNSDQTLAVSLGIAEDNTKGFYYYSDAGVPLVGLVQSSDEDPVIGLFDHNSELIWGAPEAKE